MNASGEIGMNSFAALRAIMVLVLVAAPVGATEVELPASQDSHTNTINPNKNHGNDIDMYLGEGEGVGRSRVYIQFDLSGVQGTVDRAELHLFQRASGPAAGGASCYLRRVPVPWDEGIITWANQPAAIGSAFDVQDVGGSPWQQRWVVWNATALVQGWMVNSWPNHGMVLMILEGIGAPRYGIFYSSEYSGELFPPKLLVWFSQSTAVEGSTWGKIKAQFN